MQIRLHAIERGSRANGPGLRAVLWFQGCTIRCPGCFNPSLHAREGGFLADTRDLAAEILSLRPGIEGITVSGGEPFEQPEALLDLLAGLDGSGLGRIVFTGRKLEDLQSMPLAAPILSRIDALLAGPYVASLHVARRLLGSANKQAHFLTPRYAASDLEEAPRREVILHADGTTTLSGIDPLRAERKRPGQEDAESLGPSDRSPSRWNHRAVTILPARTR